LGAKISTRMSITMKKMKIPAKKYRVYLARLIMILDPGA